MLALNLGLGRLGASGVMKPKPPAPAGVMTIGGTPMTINGNRYTIGASNG